jgi:hypothetical protein
MRRLRKNHQNQPTIDQLGVAPGAAPASRRRSALGAPRVIDSEQLRGRHMFRGLQHPPPSTGQLWGCRVSLAQGSSRGSTRLPAQISSRGVACHRHRVAPRPPCVPWAPAPTSQRRTASRAPRVPVAPGQRKNVGPSSSEIELQIIFLAPTARHRAAPGAPHVPMALS